MRRIIPLVFLAHAACGGESRANPETTGTRTTASNESTESASPPEGVVVRAEAFANGDVLAIVEANGEASVNLRGRLSVDKLVNDDWTAVDGAGLDVRADCESPAPECVSLVRGGGLRPPRWNARSRGGQCDRGGTDAPLPSGRYRFVATTCDGVHRIEGVPFDITR